ncbi:MAG TPA: vWA domain-containing protein, partial [Polyangiaceae bacterium]|nr:vWA domain-containing protein [Polyangiaceae bacterium]
GDTPTGSSLQSTVDALVAADVPENAPRFVVLCTDGIPNLCNDGNDTATGKLEAVAAAKYGFTKNVKTLVVGVGAFIDTAEGRAHFQEVADAGVGFGEPGGSPIEGTYYLASDKAALVAAFEEIRLGVRSCSFDLDATITPEAAPKGNVTVDDAPKKFNDADGWRLVGDDQIEFVGAACDQIKAGATSVRATFPCGTSGVTPKPR